MNRAAKGRSLSMALAACVVEHFRVEFESLPQAKRWIPMKISFLVLLLAAISFAKDTVEVQVVATHSVTHEARDARAITERGLMGAHALGRQVESTNLDAVINGEHVLLACDDDKGCEAPALGTYQAELKRRGHLRLAFTVPVTHKQVARWYKIAGSW